MTKRIQKTRLLVYGCLAASLCVALTALAQQPQSQLPSAAAGQPMVIHVHHHYQSTLPQHNLVMPQTASTFLNRSIPTQQAIPWQYGNQSQLGAFYQPWKQDWDHLGFTGYLGQHGGGVDVTLQQVSGLVVDTVTPGSPAVQMGLVVGDIITEINGTAVDSYKQVAVLFEETREDPKHRISLEVWNPLTRRTSTLNAVLEDGDQKNSPATP